MGRRGAQHRNRSRATVRKPSAIAVVVLALAATSAFPAPATAPVKHRAVRNAVFVGNNWDGTADVIYPRMHYKRVARINIIPDIDERMAEIASDPERLGYFLAIRQLVGEGHDQFVDDMYSSNDGRLLIVSRPSLADVVGINIATDKIVWRFPMDGQRSDHMALSPDGSRWRFWNPTANIVHLLNVRTGKSAMWS